MIQLRPFQKEALQALADPGHVICVSPTGSGKSLIYEQWIREKRPRTLLVTPLVALARQQAASLARLGLSVALGTGGAGETPSRTTDVWIVSPESLLIPSRHGQVAQWRPEFLVVDECHCIWDWGKEFRPAFAKVPDLVETLGIQRSLWLTATLPPPARQELRNFLPAPVRELGGFDLPPGFELNVLELPNADKPDALLRWVSRQRSAGFVFAPTRNSTARIAQLLREFGREAISYHAGMASEEREILEREITANPSAIVVATSAFGMGVHHPHLSWAFVWQAPYSVLSLAQALGRAGRNPDQAGKAAVLWSVDDFRLLNSRGAPGEIAALHQFLIAPGCRKTALQRYFGEISGPENCGRCDRCEK